MLEESKLDKGGDDDDVGDYNDWAKDEQDVAIDDMQLQYGPISHIAYQR